MRGPGLSGVLGGSNAVVTAACPWGGGGAWGMGRDGRYRADQVLAISDFEQSPSDGFDELGAEVWCVSRECLNNS